MKCFENPTTLEELKKQYKRLALKHHPDRGGSTADMQEINAEYDELFQILKNWHTNAKGEPYEKETTEAPEDFRDLIEQLLQMDGVEIELCGLWLWATGETKKHKDDLKALSFRWSANKSAWYYHREGYKKRSKRPVTLDEIRSMYGSEKYHKGNREEKESLSA